MGRNRFGPPGSVESGVAESPRDGRFDALPTRRVRRGVLERRRAEGRRGCDDRPTQRMDGEDVRPSHQQWATRRQPARSLAVGFALSILVAALMLVLRTGRARALRLVAERTDELRHQALHDALTDLPNRALIMDRIEQLLARSRRNGTTGAALFIDLDDFKNVNDSLGHEAGDRLLVAVAERLTSTLRDADTIGRMGGDEFVVLIDGAQLDVAPGARRRTPARRDAPTLRARGRHDAADRSTPASASRSAIARRVGSCCAMPTSRCTRRRRAGKNRYEVFHPEMQTEIMPPHRARVRSSLGARRTTSSARLPADLQPRRPQLVGVEALLRWDHPTLGVDRTRRVHPDPRADRPDPRGRPLGPAAEACEQMADVACAGRRPQHLGQRLRPPARRRRHRRPTSATPSTNSGLAGTSLIIEVTETALMHNADATARRLQAIKELGVTDRRRRLRHRLLLARLPPAVPGRLPQDRPRRSPRRSRTSPESKALVRTLVQLGKDLGLSTLAEGVETTGEIDHLRGQHVDEVQGFLLSRPLDAETLEAQLLEPTRPTTRHTTRP